MNRKIFFLTFFSSVLYAQQCQITSPLPVPVLLSGCTYSGSLPNNSTSYIQNTLSPTTTTQAFSVQYSSTSGAEYLPYISGTQCLHEVNGQTLGTGSDCGSSSGGGGGIVSPGTFTWTNNFGIAVSTIQVSSNTVIAGATFYQNGPWSIGGSLSGNLGNMIMSNGNGSQPGWSALNLAGGGQFVSGILPSGNLPADVVYNDKAPSATFTSSLTVVAAGGLGVTYNVNAGSMTGAGLSSCSATTSALTWNSGTSLFGCNTVTTVGSSTQSIHVQFGDPNNGAALIAGTTVWYHLPSSGTINAVSLDCFGQTDTFTINVSTSPTNSGASLTSICASDCPTLTAAASENDTALTGWSTSLVQDSYLAVYIKSTPPLCTYAVLTIRYLQ